MIEKLDIEGVHMVVDENIQRYISRKIGHLDKYLPKHARQSAHAEAIVKSDQSKPNHSTFEVTLYLPHEVINVEESTVSVFAAIDIVEAKLKNRIQKYKDTHESAKNRRHLLNRLRKKDAQK